VCSSHKLFINRQQTRDRERVGRGLAISFSSKIVCSIFIGRLTCVYSLFSLLFGSIIGFFGYDPSLTYFNLFITCKHSYIESVTSLQYSEIAIERDNFDSQENTNKNNIE